MSETISIYINKSTDRELYEYIQGLKDNKESVSGFFKDVAISHINSEEISLEDKIRNIIDNEYVSISKSKPVKEEKDIKSDIIERSVEAAKKHYP